MKRLLGMVLAGGLVLGQAATANAQFALSVGNPYTGTAFSLGTGYGYGGYGGYGYPGYGYSSFYGYPGYSSYYAAPLVSTTTYSSGYAGYVAPAVPYYAAGYAAAPLYPAVYPRYGYGYGGYGYRRGFGYGPYARGYGYGGYRRGWRW